MTGGCSCSLDEDCHCSTEQHQSPLMEVRFLRIIMDEGHEFSSSGHKNSTYWALQKLHVDRKWIVSGTPASGLLGVEVGTATLETSHSTADDHRLTNLDLLEARRIESGLTQESKDLDKLGTIVAGFLQIKPWANSKEHDPASWSKYIMPYSDGRRKVGSLKTLLDSLVVRHRIEDIEADIQLPPLYNRVVYLQPSWHDKLSLNLFISTLTVNAVTSERVDEDYMFHAKNRRELNKLINNLRQSGFYWTSFSPSAVGKTIKLSQAYLEEHSDPDAVFKEADRSLLKQAIEIGEIALESPSWRSFADLHEMGLLVEHFPKNSQDAWSLVHRTGDGPLLIGATQLSKAQSWVNTHLYVSDPSRGLTGLGVATMQKLWHGVQQEAMQILPDDQLGGEDLDARGKPRKKSKSGFKGTPKLTEKQTVSRAKAGPSPPRVKPPKSNASAVKPAGLKPALKSALKSSRKEEIVDPFPPDSPLARSILSGTASAKLSYLLDKVVALQQEEKILIFYEGDQIAYYIAQALDLVDVPYLIYTKTLSLERQNAYINTFNTTKTFRVLLMNVHQAAHGLHIAAASRVFFVNPVWQPNVEAQAIKRAHRIGQIRPVYVETLVLKDTLEDQMLRRRKGMTAQEHQKAEKSLLDDDTMSTIIKNARFLPFAKDHLHDTDKHVAKLSAPQQLFGRVVKSGGNFDDPDADLILDSSPQSKKSSRKRHVDILVSDYTLDMGESPLGRSSVHSTLRFAGEDGLAETLGAPDMTRKRKSDSEHAPELTEPLSTRRMAANISLRTSEEANTPESSTTQDLVRERKGDSKYSPDLTAPNPPRRRAPNVTFRNIDTSSSAGSDVPAGLTVNGSVSAATATLVDPTPAMSNARPSRRVGFNLDDSMDEPGSLFGGSAPVS